MDIVVPDVSGLDLFKEVISIHSNARIVAYSSLKSKMLIKNLLTMGVKAYVNKRQPNENLIEAIHRAKEGMNYVPEEYKALLESINSSRKEAVEVLELSEREKQTLHYILQGLLIKEIAYTLDISSSTVEKFRANLFRKFNVENVSELILAAQKMGY